MVLGIDALEHRREVEGGGLTGANCELFHSVAFRRQRNHSVGDGMKECMKQMHLKINMHALVGKQLQKIHRHSASACVKQAKRRRSGERRRLKSTQCLIRKIMKSGGEEIRSVKLEIRVCYRL